MHFERRRLAGPLDIEELKSMSKKHLRALVEMQPTYGDDDYEKIFDVFLLKMDRSDTEDWEFLENLCQKF